MRRFLNSGIRGPVETAFGWMKAAALRTAFAAILAAASWPSEAPGGTRAWAASAGHYVDDEGAGMAAGQGDAEDARSTVPLRALATQGMAQSKLPRGSR